MKIAIALIVLAALCGFAQDQSATPTPSPAASPSPSESAPPPPAAVPKKIRISQGVADGQMLRWVPPEYPKEAKKKHITGDVVLQATIDREGQIQHLTVVRGDPILAESAMKAVKQWKYKPFLLNGEPVEVETQVLVKYHM